jgi:prepilin-type N-terminal cleavage/methylation domain-containing protein
MRNKGFSLAEITIALVILAVLVTLGLPLVGNVYQDSQARVCETNQLTIKTALDVYAMEHDTIPGSISQIPAPYLSRAYAMVMSRPDAWQRRLAYFIMDSKERGLAYAADELSLKALAKGNLKLITCPEDKTPPSQGGHSYGLNSNLKNLSSRDYQNLPEGFILVADCENKEFSKQEELSTRHRVLGIAAVTKEKYPVGVTKGKHKGNLIKLIEKFFAKFDRD